MKNLPEIDFITADPQEILDECIKIVEEYLGRTLSRADPLRLLIEAFVAIIIQLRLKIDYIAKQNLLAYAEGEYLEHLGALVGVERLPAARAVTTCQVTLSAPRLQATTILAGTRITGDEEIYFALDEDVVFAAGETSKTCAATCLSVGEIGNNFAIGELSKIIDPQPWLLSITNVTVSEGGADVESDDSLRERIHTAPESFSVAGAAGAYVFWAKSTSQLIADVAVESPEPTRVNVYVLLKNGVIPQTEMLNLVYENLSDETRRPLTDLVTVLAPSAVNFNVNLSYYISREDSTNAAQIVEDAEKAVADFVAWQKEKIGRDINPSELIHRLKAAGVKRVEVTSPTFSVVGSHEVAVAQNVTATFAGFEDF